MIVVSTSSDQDLSKWNTPLVQFSRQLPDGKEHTLLHFEHKWFLGSKHGCSCGFRHLSHGSQELGFSEPVDWWPEESEDLEATHQAIKLFKRLVISGAQVDCIDARRRLIWRAKPISVSDDVRCFTLNSISKSLCGISVTR